MERQDNEAVAPTARSAARRRPSRTRRSRPGAARVLSHMTENPGHQSKEREVADRLDARTRFAFLLGALFSVEVVLLALRPMDRGDWALENAIALPFAAVLLWDSRRNPLWRSSYALSSGSSRSTRWEDITRTPSSLMTRGSRR